MANTDQHSGGAPKKGGVFYNPWPTWQDKGLIDVLKWQWTRKQVPLPSKEQIAMHLPVVEPDMATLRNPPANDVTVTWIGHATLLVQAGGVTFLTDPIWSYRASPLSFAGPARLVPPPLPLDALPPIDFVVVSHNHYDHLDKATVKKLGNTCKWFVPLGLKGWFRSVGVTNVEELDWWQQHHLKDGVTVTATPCQHWSSRKGHDRCQTLWCSFVISAGSKKVYFSGDTGYCSVFKEVGQRLGPFDLAMLPIGSYDPRWFMCAQHVDPEEAVQMHIDLQSRASVGMHWGTFNLSDEPFLEPPNRVAAEMKRLGLAPSNFFTLRHGETRILSSVSCHP